MKKPRLPETKVRIPIPEVKPPKVDLAAEFDRLYLEKCKEVNELEQKVEKFKSMAEIAVKQKGEFEKQLEEARQTIREMEKPPLVCDLIRRGDALKAVHDANTTITALPDMKPDQLNDIASQFDKRYSRTLELIEAIPAAPRASTIRELAAEPLKGFTPDVEPPEELPEALMEELPLWALQPVTTQDILCLSSALKNLYDIHKCDGWLLYNKLAKVLENKIKEYCGED